MVLKFLFIVLLTDGFDNAKSIDVVWTACKMNRIAILKIIKYAKYFTALGI